MIPPKRIRYLSEIADTNRNYDEKVNQQVHIAEKLYGIYQTILSVITKESETSSLETKYSFINKSGINEDEIFRQAQNKKSNVIPTEGGTTDEESQTFFLKLLCNQFEKVKLNLDPYNWEIIMNWQEKIQKYKKPIYSFKVRDKEINIETHSESLSHTKIPKIALPKYQAWGAILRWSLQENVPGEFPFTAGLYPFKRTGEDPTRMFAGEGGPERTNRRFHYVSLDMDAKRLSTAFDSVTLYGNDPDHRPDIYGKIGNAGVSICCLDDAKKLYSGFDLSDVMTSVSMTINGPAATICAFFMNAAIDQQCELYIKEK